MRYDVEFFPVVVTDRPTGDSYAPSVVNPVDARIARAGELREGDMVLAYIDPVPAGLARTDHHADEYPAHPKPFDPACGCYMCELPDYRPGPYIVVTDGFPWDACDVWPVDVLALVVPTQRLH